MITNLTPHYTILNPMFIPLDNLYEFISQKISNHLILIYRFYPHGSRKLENIDELRHINPDWKDWTKIIPLFMHDQEPLDFDFYKNLSADDIHRYLCCRYSKFVKKLEDNKILDTFLELVKNDNFHIMRHKFISDQWMLCHSEKNSQNLKKYEEIGAIGIYWWCHAFIAKDWYRFAKIDQRLNYYPEKFDFDFNLYSRAWQGTREYRLKMLDLCIDKGLVTNSMINFGKIENDTNWKNHHFTNPQFKIHRDLDCLDNRQVTSSASATYSVDDYQKCAIDVVLETLFDDDRNHLTEKILRPIACGKPFLLVSTPNSLGYLKSYGFETFDSLIDESYDNIQDPLERLNRITDLMKDISTLSSTAKSSLYEKMHVIAQRNKQRFWSDEFSQTIISEFDTNYQNALKVCQASCNGKNWLQWRKLASNYNQDYKKFLVTDNDTRSRKDIVKIMMEIKKIKS
jgi:hypothetical protein